MDQQHIETLAAELRDDPKGIGYRDETGAFKPSDELTQLLLQPQIVDNPEPQRELPAPMDIKEIMAAVSNASLAKVPYDALMAIHQAVAAQDRERLMLQLQVATAKQWLTPDEVMAIEHILAKTVPDPAWEPKIKKPCRLTELTGEKALGNRDLWQILSAARNVETV